MAGNRDRLALRRIEQLPEAVLRLYRSHGHHRLHLKKLANMDRMANIAILQQGSLQETDKIARQGANLSGCSL
jgi:hypothetical protein